MGCSKQAHFRRVWEVGKLSSLSTVLLMPLDRLFLHQTVGKVATQERLLLTLALATAVTSEMWGTSLRWNAYFNPVFLILYIHDRAIKLALVRWPRSNSRGWRAVLLYYTSYLTVVAAPVLSGNLCFCVVQGIATKRHCARHHNSFGRCDSVPTAILHIAIGPLTLLQHPILPFIFGRVFNCSIGRGVDYCGNAILRSIISLDCF